MVRSLPRDQVQAKATESFHEITYTSFEPGVVVGSCICVTVLYVGDIKHQCLLIDVWAAARTIHDCKSLL